jgi:hypothetical protein
MQSSAPLVVFQGTTNQVSKFKAHGPFTTQLDALEVHVCYGDLKWDQFVAVGRSPLNSTYLVVTPEILSRFCLLTSPHL